MRPSGTAVAVTKNPFTIRDRWAPCSLRRRGSTGRRPNARTRLASRMARHLRPREAPGRTRTGGGTSARVRRRGDTVREVALRARLRGDEAGRRRRAVDAGVEKRREGHLAGSETHPRSSIRRRVAAPVAATPTRPVAAVRDRDVAVQARELREARRRVCRDVSGSHTPTVYGGMVGLGEGRLQEGLVPNVRGAPRTPRVSRCTARARRHGSFPRHPRLRLDKRAGGGIRDVVVGAGAVVDRVAAPAAVRRLQARAVGRAAAGGRVARPVAVSAGRRFA